MIGTLFAQEFRATRKTLFTVLGILLLVLLTGYGAAMLRVPVLNGFGMMIGIIATALITPAVLAVLVVNYWRTMYGAQGYFTMTVPVRGRNIYAAKVLYGLAATYCALLLTGLAVALGVIVFTTAQGQGGFDAIREAIEMLEPGLVWVVIAVLVLQLSLTVVLGATALSVGAEGRFNHLGFGAPVIFAVIAYFVMQFLTLLTMAFVPLGLKLSGPDAWTIVPESMLADFKVALDLALAGTNSNVEPNVIGIGFVPVIIIVTIVLAWWGGRSVDRRTSLR